MPDGAGRSVPGRLDDTVFGWLQPSPTGLGSRSRIQQALIMGTAGQRSFPIVDRRLEKETISASSMQRKTASGIARGIRFFVNTHACELAILKAIQKKWPGTGQDRVEVKLHL